VILAVGDSTVSEKWEKVIFLSKKRKKASLESVTSSLSSGMFLFIAVVDVLIPEVSLFCCLSLFCLTKRGKMNGNDGWLFLLLKMLFAMIGYTVSALLAVYIREP